MSDRASDRALSSVIRSMTHPPAGGKAAAPTVPPALAGVVVLLVAALGAWLVYRYAFRGASAPVADVVELDDTMMMRPPGMFGSVTRQRGAIHVRGTDFQMRAAKSGENAYNITFDFPPDVRRSWVTAEQWELHQLAQRATSIPKFARHIKLTDEQRRQLQALSPNIQLTAAEVQKLRPYLSDWDRAKDEPVRRSAEQPLIDAAQQVAAARRAEAQAAQLRRVQEIPKIVTAEQRKLAESYMLPLPVESAPPPAPAASSSSSAP